MLHAGGVEGWVDGADLVFRSKTKSADYHDEMNSEHFMEWMTQQLLPRLEEPSVVILDNASYHNKQRDKPPTTQNKKDEIKEWLDKHNITYDSTDIKKTLLEKVKQYRTSPIYLTDEAAHEHGHTVLRLPVGHCELNPIELAWASVKGYVAKHNRDYNLAEVEQLVPKGFEHTTTDMWRKFCKHVIDIENEYIEKDGIVEDTLDEMTIEIGVKDDSDDDDDEDDDIDDLLDDTDRQVIDRALQAINTQTVTGQSTSSGLDTSLDICTHPR